MLKGPDPFFGHNFSGAGVHQRLIPIANAIGASLLLAIFGVATLSAETGGNTLRRVDVEPAAWQGRRSRLNWFRRRRVIPSRRQRSRRLPLRCNQPPRRPRS